jgi:hypothetical protein
METKYSADERLEMLGTDDLSLWGIREGKDRALWAETKLFWAKSVAENLKYIKEVGESVRPNFVILPNWGEMQLTDGNEFREEIGHDLREWAPQSDLQMFEESNEPGSVSLGVYLDFILELKFALANDVRGAVLSHAGADASTIELSYAECLAGLGTFIQHGTSFPDVRGKYRRFQEANAKLLEGWDPYYTVGVAYFYNQLHLENMEHMRQVHKFTRYLSDQHVLFHYLTEEDISPEVRLPCRVLIIPSVSFLSEDQVAGIGKFLASGGICIATGSLGDFDERARERKESVVAKLASSYPVRFIHAEMIGDLIPDDDMSLDSARLLSRTTWRTLNVPGGQSFAVMKHLDEELGIQRYMEGGALEDLLARGLDGTVVLSPPRSCIGVRFNAYKKDDSVALHVVNYNLDLTVEQGKRCVAPASDVEVKIALPEGHKVREALAWEPGRRSEKLDWSQQGRTVELAIPALEYYKLVLLRGS